MQRGDVIVLRAHKSDGTVYRWWRATVESIDAERVVVVNRVGDRVDGPGGGWSWKHALRATYWFDRSYNLVEAYHADGRLKQIYIHIATPAVIQNNSLNYTDLELDVIKRPGQPLRIVDEDEFDEAARYYGYTPEFQCSCREAVDEAMRLAKSWRCTGAPTMPDKRSSRPHRRWRRRRRRSTQDVRTEVPAADSSTRSNDV